MLEKRKYRSMSEYHLRLERADLIKSISRSLYRGDLEEKLVALPYELTARMIQKDDKPQLVKTLVERVMVETYKFIRTIFEDPSAINDLYKLYLIDQEMYRRTNDHFWSDGYYG